MLFDNLICVRKRYPLVGSGHVPPRLSSHQIYFSLKIPLSFTIYIYTWIRKTWHQWRSQPLTPRGGGRPPAWERRKQRETVGREREKAGSREGRPGERERERKRDRKPQPTPVIFAGPGNRRDVAVVSSAERERERQERAVCWSSLWKKKKKELKDPVYKNLKKQK